jgi:hypothetical protein
VLSSCRFLRNSPLVAALVCKRSISAPREFTLCASRTRTRTRDQPAPPSLRCDPGQAQVRRGLARSLASDGIWLERAGTKPSLPPSSTRLQVACPLLVRTGNGAAARPGLRIDSSIAGVAPWVSLPQAWASLPQESAARSARQLHARQSTCVDGLAPGRYRRLRNFAKVICPTRRAGMCHG